MKKISTLILAIAALTGCEKGYEESVIDEQPVDVTGFETYIEIGVSAGTRATYDEGLHFFWETGDKLQVVQGSASNVDSVIGSAVDMNASGSTIDLVAGEGTNSASFAGTISAPDTRNRYFHFAYPSAATLVTTTHVKGSIGGSFSTSTSFEYSLQSTQNGRWVPVFCASTTEKVQKDNLSNIALGKSLDACLALRIFSNDEKTAKQASKITIKADNNIIGTLSATTADDGSFNGMTFNVNGTGDTIVGDNLLTLAKVGNYYEYRFEVLPNVTVHRLEIGIDDNYGGHIDRVIEKDITFKANKCVGFNIKWDKADVYMSATSWWEENAKDSAYVNTLAEDGGKIYFPYLFVGGLDENDTLKQLYFNITDTNGETKTIEVGKDDNLIEIGTNSYVYNVNPVNGVWGQYTITPYAVYESEGTTETLEGKTQTIVVTRYKPLITVGGYTIKSSYNAYNNNSETIIKDNNLAGNKVYADVSILSNGSAASALELQLVDIALVCGNDTFTGTTGSQIVSEELRVGQRDCTVNVSLKVGNSVNRDQLRSLPVGTHAIDITGIPSYNNFYPYSGDIPGWTIVNCDTQSKQLAIASTSKGSGYIVTPAFYIPGSIDINYNFENKFYAGYYRAEVSLYIGATDSSNTQSTSAMTFTYRASTDTSATSGTNQGSGTLTMTSDYNYISIASGDVGGTSLASRYHYIHEFNVTYQ